MNENDLIPLRLGKGEDRRLRAGHLWVFSNEVDVRATPLQGFQPGQPVAIETAHGQWVGSGYVNPNALLCARLVSRDREHPLGRSLLVHRLRIALGLRERLYPNPFYRLVFGESDGLPGLVVDRYGDVLAVQISTAGMERLKDDILAALEKVLKPQAIVWRNDSPLRTLEGLPLYREVAMGQPPEWIELPEGAARFLVSPLMGQKTGWFYDQADNRARLARYCRGKRVLDVFCYLGAWGIQAALAGASEVWCLDSSPTALEQVTRHAVQNGVAERLKTLPGDAFDNLKALHSARERFDILILDPPAFIKRRKDTEAGFEAYRRINQLGLQLLNSDGLLVTSSCSFHLGQTDFLGLIQQAARHLDRSLQRLEVGQQGPDHPVHPAIAETSYLKTLFLRTLFSF
ncbi:MAG: class I SAM-dependent rRNA methyltransferase [Pseudomonadota bacterium]